MGHVYTLLAVIFGWVLFAFDNFSQGIAYMGRLFGAGGIALANNTSLYALLSNLPLLIILVIASTPVGNRAYTRLRERARAGTCTVVDGILMIAGFILCVAYLVDSTYNPFLYFRF